MKIIAQSPIAEDFVQDPYPFYDRARALGPVVFWTDWDLQVATDFATVNAALRDRRMGRAPLDPPAIPAHLAPFQAVEAHSMLELEPPDHTRLRGLVLRAFTSRRIAALAPEIEALCHELIDTFPEEPFDLLPQYANKVPVIIIARLLGVPDDRADDLLVWSNAIVAMYQARRDRHVEDAAALAATEFSAFLGDYVRYRRARPADDLISQLIAAETDGEKLSPDELISTCILLLNAGHEATVHTIGNGVRALLHHGKPDITPETVEEILRWDPPLHLFTRHVYEDIEIDGVPLQRGDQLGCLLAAANRDPKAFDDPHRFDPARPICANASFGAGIHFCVGAPLARLEMQIALRILFDRNPDLALAEEPQYANLYHFHGLERLMVTR